MQRNRIWILIFFLKNQKTTKWSKFSRYQKQRTSTTKQVDLQVGIWLLQKHKCIVLIMYMIN